MPNRSSLICFAPVIPLNKLKDQYVIIFIVPIFKCVYSLLVALQTARDKEGKPRWSLENIYMKDVHVCVLVWSLVGCEEYYGFWLMCRFQYVFSAKMSGWKCNATNQEKLLRVQLLISDYLKALMDTTLFAITSFISPYEFFAIARYNIIMYTLINNGWWRNFNYLIVNMFYNIIVAVFYHNIDLDVTYIVIK